MEEAPGDKSGEVGVLACGGLQCLTMDPRCETWEKTPASVVPGSATHPTMPIKERSSGERQEKSFNQCGYARKNRHKNTGTKDLSSRN